MKNKSIIIYEDNSIIAANKPARLASVPARHRDVLVDAHTEYKVLARTSGGLCSLVEIRITTGRKHQIRRHFAMIKFPIVLDDEYGDRKFNRKFRLKFRLGRHFLHAWKILFAHPITGKNIEIVAPVPPDLSLILKRLNILLLND